MGEEKVKISVEDLRVEKISDRHVPILMEFKSSNKELRDFLIEDALENQEISISTTYLIFYNPLNKLLAYVTLCSDAIRVHGTKLGKTFHDKGVPYKTLPALKVCRLCIDKDYEHRGIGTITTLFTMRKLLEINEKSSCRFLVVDAKRDSVQFYKKNKFQILKSREKGTLPMYYDMIKQIKLFRENKKKLSKLKE